MPSCFNQTKLKKGRLCTQKNHFAPVGRSFIPLFIGLHPSQLVEEFVHPQNPLDPKMSSFDPLLAPGSSAPRSKLVPPSHPNLYKTLWMEEILHHLETMVATIKFVGIFRGIIIPGFLGWCRTSSIHSIVYHSQEASLRCLCPNGQNMRKSWPLADC